MTRFRTAACVLLLGVLVFSQLSAQCPDGSPPPCGGQPAARRPTPADRTVSLSVLYLENASLDTTDIGLADGMTEELVTRLSQVDGLRVTSRYAALRYRGHRVLDPRIVGRELGVRYVLHGTLRRAEDRVRIAVEVTDAGTGYNVWAHTYEQELRDVFRIQDSVAVQVAEAVRGRLTGRERQQLSPALTTTSEVYQAYLRGRAAIRGRSAGAAAQAVAHYRRALELDPTFARAYAGLAHSYSLTADWGWDLPGVPDHSLQTYATRAADRALALDSLQADSWLAAGMAWRFESTQRSLEYLRRAVALDPTNIEALHQLAWGYYGVGELDTAIAIEQQVITRDPFYAYPYAGLADMLNMAGRPLEALAWATQGGAIDSTLGVLYEQIATANLRLGRPLLASAAAARGLALGAPPVTMRVLLALAKQQAGDTASARGDVAAVTAELRVELTKTPGGLARQKAGIVSAAYAQFGEADSALAWAGRLSNGGRRFNAVWLERHWYWAPVRGDPRFQAMLANLRQ